MFDDLNNDFKKATTPLQKSDHSRGLFRIFLKIFAMKVECWKLMKVLFNGSCVVEFGNLWKVWLLAGFKLIKSLQEE